jgi:hypothetical protein
MTTVYADNYGFNKNDATGALQSAINDANADKIIVRNMGNPWLISETIFLKSNKEIDFEPDVVIRAKSGTFLSNTKPLFRAASLDNIKLVGQGVGVHQATLSMNRNEYTDTNAFGNQFGHIVEIDGTNNYVISGLTLTGAGGDGIIINGADFGHPTSGLRTYSENGVIDNVTSDNNRRQAMSVISAKGLVVKNSNFINTSGVAPSSGIDFEPDYNYERLQDIQLSNVNISNNNGNGISFALSNLDNNSPSISIDITGVTINNNNSSGISVGIYPSAGHPNSNFADSTPNGVINVRNTTIAGTKGTNSFDLQLSAAISIDALSGDRSDPNNLKVNFDSITISDTANNKFSTNPILIRGFGGPLNRQQIGNLSFNNVTVNDGFKRDIVGIALGRPDGYLNNISGNITGINPNGVTSNFTHPTAPPQNFSLTVKDRTATNTAQGFQLVNPTFNGLTGWYVYPGSVVSVVNRPGQPNWVDIAAKGGGLEQDITSDIVTGQSYTVGGNAKLSQAAQAGDSGIFGVFFKDAFGNRLGVSTVQVTNSTAQYFQLGFTAPPNFAAAELFAYKNPGTADLFVGDFTLFKQ